MTQINPTLKKDYLSGPLFYERTPRKILYGTGVVALSLVAAKIFTRMTWTQFAVSEAVSVVIGGSWYGRSFLYQTPRDYLQKTIRVCSGRSVQLLKAVANSNANKYQNQSLPVPVSKDPQLEQLQLRNYVAAQSLLHLFVKGQFKPNFVRFAQCYAAYFHHLVENPMAELTPEQMEKRMEAYIKGTGPGLSLEGVKKQIWQSSELSRRLEGHKDVKAFVENLIPEGVTPTKIHLVVGMRNGDDWILNREVITDGRVAQAVEKLLQGIKDPVPKPFETRIAGVGIGQKDGKEVRFDMYAPVDGHSQQKSDLSVKVYHKLCGSRGVVDHEQVMSDFAAGLIPEGVTPSRIRLGVGFRDDENKIVKADETLDKDPFDIRPAINAMLLSLDPKGKWPMAVIGIGEGKTENGETRRFSYLIDHSGRIESESNLDQYEFSSKCDHNNLSWS